MTHGSFMGSPSESGPAGTRIQDFTLGFRELRSALALGSGSSAGSAGAGDIGDMTGIITESCSTTTATFLTAEFSPIAALIMAAGLIEAAGFMAQKDFVVEGDFMAEEQEGSRADSMDSRVLIPGHLAVSIMAECREAFLHAG